MEEFLVILIVMIHFNALNVSHILTPEFSVGYLPNLQVSIISVTSLYTHLTSASWEAYTEMFCWAKNTYFLPMEDEIPESVEDRDYRQISYYQ